MKVQNDTWKTIVPNSFFGSFNPYSELIRGDWFDPKQRQHHTGAVYRNGQWLMEAARLDDVLLPFGDGLTAVRPDVGSGVGERCLAAGGPGPGDMGRIAATSFSQTGHSAMRPARGGKRLRGLDQKRQLAPLRAG